MRRIFSPGPVTLTSDKSGTLTVEAKVQPP